MTVAELIEKLKEFPKDYTVIAVDTYGTHTISEVNSYDEPFNEVELS